VIEKRFEFRKWLNDDNSSDDSIYDSFEDIDYDLFMDCDLERLVDQMNALHEENQQCKEYNAIIYANSTKNDREHIKQINQLQKENQRIKQTIREAYETERTQIGKNTLKQLLEALE
jgi:DNA anti-recombination protein RmuC